MIKGVIILFFLQFSIVSNAQQGIPFLTKDNKYKFVDSNFNVINPEKFTIKDLEYRNEVMYVSKNDRPGLVNKLGKELTGFQYDYIKPSYIKMEGFIVLKNKKYGINYFNSKENLPCIYDYLDYYRNGTLHVKKEGKSYLQKNGKDFYYENLYKEIAPIPIDSSNNVFVVKDYNNKYGVLNNGFIQIIPCKYVSVNVKKNIISARESNSSKVIILFNLKGKRLTNDTLYDMQELNSELVLIKIKRIPKVVPTKKISEDVNVAILPVDMLDKEQYRWKCISNSGNSKQDINNIESFYQNKQNFILNSEKFNILINEKVIYFSKEYSFITPIFNGGFIAKKGDYYGVLDSRQKIIIPFIYSEFYVCQSNNYLLKKRDKWFLFNSDNVKKDSINSEYPNSDSDGLLVFYRDIYDIKKKKFLIQDAESIEKAYNNFIIKKDGKYGMINRDGVTIVPYEYDGVLFSYADKLNRFEGVWFKTKNYFKLFNAQENKLLTKEFVNTPVIYQVLDNFYILQTPEGFKYLVDKKGKEFKED